MSKDLRLVPPGKYKAVLDDIRAPTLSRQGRFYVSLVFLIDGIEYPLISHQYCSLTLGHMIYEARDSFIGWKYRLTIKNITLEHGEYNETIVGGLCLD